MKKIIKRLLTGVLALATICTSLPASPVMAKERASTTGSVVLEKHPQLTYQFDEYSCAVTPQIRQTGNRLSGLAETAYASLLA